MKSDVAPPKTCVNDLHVRTEKYFFSTGSRSLKNSAVSQFLLLPLVKWVKRAPNKPTNQTTKQPTKQPTNQPTNQTTKQRTCFFVQGSIYLGSTEDFRVKKLASAVWHSAGCGDHRQRLNGRCPVEVGIPVYLVKL